MAKGQEAGLLFSGGNLGHFFFFEVVSVSFTDALYRGDGEEVDVRQVLLL